jgi:PhnB protein
MAAVNPIPKGLHTLTPNLVFRGCAEAIEFYKRALGAEELARALSPDGRSVWHAQLRVGDSNIFVNDMIEGTSVPAPTAANPAPVVMWLYVPDVDAAYRKAVAAGGKSTMEPADMFWGDRCAGVADPYGYLWSFATRKKEPTPEEMKRASEDFARSMSRQKKG